MTEPLSTEQRMHEGTLREDGTHCDGDCWCWEDRYMIVSRQELQDLIVAVNTFIHQKGWKPIGGVSHQEREEYQLWAQAMVRNL